MAIDVPVAEVYALAEVLRAAAGDVEEARGRLGGGDVGSGLQPAVDRFLECHRVAAAALAGELEWLGATVTSVVDSWLEHDAALLGVPDGAALR